MILDKPKFHILFDTEEDLIERSGRTCYKSEDKMLPGKTVRPFIKSLIARGHHSVLEHSMATVKFIIDRGVSHELVRHRLCAFSQESTRYCKYDGHVTFIIPPWCDKIERGIYDSKYIVELPSGLPNDQRTWINSMARAETAYKSLLKDGWKPQQARSVLPNSLKTEIVVSANYREWRHIFQLRCSKAAHPQMREIMVRVLQEFKRCHPNVFEDIYPEVSKNVLENCNI